MCVNFLYHWSDGFCRRTEQGCQMVYCKTENPNLGKFWRALEWKMLPIWNTLRPFGIHILCSFGNFEVIWYLFPRFGTLCQEKSGTPGTEPFARIAWYGIKSTHSFTH
jgi:hypothetical protein